MPKDRRLNFLSSDRARASPYACSSKESNQDKFESSLPPIGDEKEWEQARCPICMEHPHNAVLLLCSSRDKGCRPYMCDTSHRHSNCLDQFCESVAGASSTELQDGNVTRMQYPRGRVEQTLLRLNRSTGGWAPELLCPLCRGQVSGWVVIEKARWYMNSKVRSCSLESCNFTGNYVELRKHARYEHPTMKPSDVDPERQSEWVRLERERDLGDTLSAVRSQFGYDSYVDYSPSNMLPDWSWVSDDSISDETEDEWSEDGDMSVDFDVGVEVTFSFLNEFSSGPSEGARNTSIARTSERVHNRRSMRSRSRGNHGDGITSIRRRDTTPARSGSEGARNAGSERIGGRSLNRRSMRSGSRENHGGGITSTRRRDTTPARSGSEGARNSGSERIGGRSLNRRSMRSRSRSNQRLEITFPRQRDTTPTRSGPVGVRIAGGERSLGRRSMRLTSRSNQRVEITSPRRQDTALSWSGSEWATNTGSARIGSRSLGWRSIASRSRSNHRGETTSSRSWNTSSSRSGSWRYAE